MWEAPVTPSTCDNDLCSKCTTHVLSAIRHVSKLNRSTNQFVKKSKVCSEIPGRGWCICSRDLRMTGRAPTALYLLQGSWGLGKGSLIVVKASPQRRWGWDWGTNRRPSTEGLEFRFTKKWDSVQFEITFIMVESLILCIIQSLGKIGNTWK